MLVLHDQKLLTTIINRNKMGQKKKIKREKNVEEAGGDLLLYPN